MTPLDEADPINVGDRVRGKVAIVTGAGSLTEGIGNGRGIALMLARHGARVAVIDIDEAAAAMTARMITAEGGEAMVLQADVADVTSCEATVAQVVKKWGRLDILVNNVGTSRVRGNAVDLDLDEWDRGMRINVKSMVMMTRFAVPEMTKTGGGSIINTASITALAGGHPNLFYPTSKAAVVHLTKTMAGQHGEDGIRVNAVAPGFVYTPVVYGAGLPDGVRESRQQASALKTEGTAWDVAFAVLYLASDEARWVTGVLLPVDAGTSAISSHFQTSARRTAKLAVLGGTEAAS
jgi:NAD(P)-dependent dehydrogenase (short-subunit alcohol dehydrogenase family)